MAGIDRSNDDSLKEFCLPFVDVSRRGIIIQEDGGHDGKSVDILFTALGCRFFHLGFV